MKTKRRIALIVAPMLAVALCAPNAQAQRQRKTAQNQIFQVLLRFEQNVPPAQRNLFSSAVKNLLGLAHSVLDTPTAGPDDDGGEPPLKLSGTRSAGTTKPLATATAAAAETALAKFMNAAGGNRSGGVKADVVPISSLSGDFQLTHVAGFNQSTTSTAWCGNNIVTAYQSSLAGVITNTVPFIQNPSLFASSASSVGVAASADDGESFIDQPILNPGPTVDTATENDATAMSGNPVVACGDASKFFIATSPFGSVKADLQNSTITELLSGVGLSVSTDGGKDWGNPVGVANKNGFFHLVDRAWLAIDPNNPSRMYVSYTDFDLEGIFSNTVATARCPNTPRQAIELVSSSDGGRTWNATPTIVHEVCEQFVNNVLVSKLPTGSQVTVGTDGKVFVSYTLFAADSSDELRFRRSLDHGNTFDPEVLVSNVVPTGDPAGASAGTLQAFFNNIQVPAMAVDSSRKDTLYIAWSDGRGNPQPDVVSPTGVYNFADILMARSTDGGSTWSVPRAVSPTPLDFAGLGRDQFQPGIAVNRDGTLAVCYYDRRNDPLNMGIDRFCSISKDHGASFEDQRQTTATWPPIHAVDFFVGGGYIGEYDTVAAHQGSGNDDRFFGAFQIISNDVATVHGRSFRSEK